MIALNENDDRQVIFRDFLPKYDLPQSILPYQWINRRRMPFFRHIHVPMMQTDSRLSLAMDVIRGAVTSLTKFYVDETGLGTPEDNENDNGDDWSDQKRFVVRQLKRWWRNAASKMLTAMEWGYMGGQVMYKRGPSGMIEYDCLQQIHANDVRPVTVGQRLVGIVVERPNDHGGGGQRFIGGEKALWHVHWRHVDPWYGQTRYYHAFDPWNELYSEGGALDVRRLYYYKHVYQGDIGRFPEGSAPPDQNSNGARNPHRDIMREIIESMRAGSVVNLPSERDPVTGEYLWDIESKERTGQEAKDVLEYVNTLKRELVEGVGLSEEIFQAANTGSGFSGRKIPEQAFRGWLSEIAFWMVSDFDEQVIRPLIRRNKLGEPDYEIVPFGLVDEDGNMEEQERPGQLKSTASPNIPARRSST